MRLPRHGVWLRALRDDEIQVSDGVPRLCGGCLRAPGGSETTVADAVRFGSRRDFHSSFVHLTGAPLVALHYALAGGGGKWMVALDAERVTTHCTITDLRCAAGRKAAGLAIGSHEDILAANSQEILVSWGLSESYVLAFFDASRMSQGTQAYAAPDHEELLGGDARRSAASVQ